MDNPADLIFHEQQQGALCAQHCLNSLLQGSYFSPVDLAEIAQQLDAYELDVMSEGDVSSHQFRKFANNKKSMNMDDSGFFSIQVITQALQVWNIECIPWMSEEAKSARENPLKEKAFICNLQEHWLTIRRFGKHWANLNSTLKRPQFISDMYLNLLLLQLQQDGYSVFVVRGQLPRSAADELISQLPDSAIIYGDVDSQSHSQSQSQSQSSQPSLTQSKSISSSGNIHTLSSLSSSKSDASSKSFGKTTSGNPASLSKSNSGTSGIDSFAPNSEIAKKLENALPPQPTVTRPVDMDEVRAKRLQRFASNANTNTNSNSTPPQ